jgi:hypothetical protein
MNRTKKHGLATRSKRKGGDDVQVRLPTSGGRGRRSAARQAEYERELAAFTGAIQEIGSRVLCRKPRILQPRYASKLA